MPKGVNHYGDQVCLMNIQKVQVLSCIIQQVSLTHFFFKKKSLCLCVHACAFTNLSTHVEVRGQLVEAGFFYSVSPGD